MSPVVQTGKTTFAYKHNSDRESCAFRADKKQHFKHNVQCTKLSK